MTTPEPPGPRQPDPQIFDTLADGQFACRICGALVQGAGPYPDIHWEWHEASNGA
jgi:hypothetical protein